MRALLRIALSTLLLASAGAAPRQEPERIGFRCLLREAEAFVLEDGVQVLVTGGDFALGEDEPVPHVVRVSRASSYEPWALDWIARLEHPVRWGFGALHAAGDANGGAVFVDSSDRASGTTAIDAASGEVIERLPRHRCLDVRRRAAGGCVALLSDGASTRIWSAGELTDATPIDGAPVAGKLLGEDDSGGPRAVLAVSRRVPGRPAEVDVVSLTSGGTRHLGAVDDPLGADHFALDARLRGEVIEGALALSEGHRGQVACFDAAPVDPISFSSRWILDPDRDPGFHSPVFANDVALIGAGDAPPTVVVPRFGAGESGALFGFDLRDGAQRWRQRRPFGDFVGLDVDALDDGTLLAVGGGVSMGEWDAHGHAQGLTSQDGGPPRSSWSLSERALRKLLVDVLR